MDFDQSYTEDMVEVNKKHSVGVAHSVKKLGMLGMRSKATMKFMDKTASKLGGLVANKSI